MQQELMAFAYRKRPLIENDDSTKTWKRLKTSKKCYTCGKMGHITAECWNNTSNFNKNTSNKEDTNQISNTTTSKSTITCFKCGMMGHIASKCSNKEPPKQTERRINFCSMRPITGTLTQSDDEEAVVSDSEEAKEGTATSLSHEDV
ncbi:uncharacterized protein [Venturia canescens]|nr:uncharacterized protein LOC122414965 [Venturia canescens]